MVLGKDEAGNGGRKRCVARTKVVCGRRAGGGRMVDDNGCSAREKKERKKVTKFPLIFT